MIISGIIIEQHKSVFLVDTDNGIVPSTITGIVRSGTDKPCVGDHVGIEITDSIPQAGLIRSVEPRRNRLIRPTIANVNQVIYVFTVAEPPIDLEAFDRFLFAVGTMSLDVLLVLNKIDLLSREDLMGTKDISQAYRYAEYQVLEMSAATGENVSSLTALCRGKISCLAGASGVGKSSLLNVLFPDLNARTQELSEHISRGRQTTTSTLLLKLDGGGYIADSPGFQALEIPYVYPEETQLYFPEIKRLIGQCRFNNCLHENEPGCVVQEKVDSEEISGDRYEHYLHFMDIMRTHRDKYSPPGHKRPR